MVARPRTRTTRLGGPDHAPGRRAELGAWQLPRGAQTTAMPSTSENPTLSPSRGGAWWKVALVALAAAGSLAASWERWINPFVDSGREMNVPARLADGERLYRDVIFYYGPAGPWLHSLALRLGAPAGHSGGRSWLPLELACLALTAAILVLLYRLTRAAGGAGTALAAAALAAAFCVGAPHGGAFIFPYSAASLYALAGSLLALVASSRPPSWRRRALVAGGVALALGARVEIGVPTAVILLVAALRFRRGPARDADDTPATPTRPDAPNAPNAPNAPAGDAVPGTPAGAGSSILPAVLDVALGALAGIAVYAAAFAGIPWQMLVAHGPFTHLLAMPPEWQVFYRSVSGLARPGRSFAKLAWSLGLDAALLAACALSWAPASASSPRRRRLRRLLHAFAAAAIAAAVASYGQWGGALGLRWSRAGDELPPVLFMLPLLAAAAAALAALLRPADERGRSRFLLFALAASLGARVPLGLTPGPNMFAYCALPIPLLLATAAVLAGDVLAPRLRNPGGFRRRLAALAVGLAALYLLRLGLAAWGPHIVPLETAAGRLRLPWKEAYAIEGTLDYLAAHARPGDRLASFPEAGFFNFVTGLRNPLREEEIFPGVLDSNRERQAARRLLASRTRFVLLANRPTGEWGARAFGDDYAVELWQTVEDHYNFVATFGNAGDDARIGGRRFFIRVYELPAMPTRVAGLPWPPVSPSCRLGLVVHSGKNQPPAADLPRPGEQPAQRLRIGDVLLLEDARREGVRSVAVEHRHGALHDDGAAVQALVHQVDGAAADLHPVLEGLRLGVDAGKGREQAGVDVEDAPRKGRHEIRREQAHVAGQADPIDARPAQGGDQLRLVAGAIGLAAVGDGERRQPALPRPVEAGGRRHVAGDQGDLGRQLAPQHGVVQRQEVAAAPREQDAEAVHRPAFPAVSGAVGGRPGRRS